MAFRCGSNLLRGTVSDNKGRFSLDLRADIFCISQRKISKVIKKVCFLTSLFCSMVTNKLLLNVLKQELNSMCWRLTKAIGKIEPLKDFRYPDKKGIRA